MAHRKPVAHLMTPLVALVLAAALAPAAWGSPSEPQDEAPKTTTLSLQPSAEDVQLAQQVIPGLADGPISIRTKTFAGTQALARGSKGKYVLQRVERGPTNPEGEALAVIWLAAASPIAPATFSCEGCSSVALAIVVLPEEGSVIAVAKHANSLTGASTAHPLLSEHLGSHTLYPIERIDRQRGSVVRSTTFLVRRGRTLLEAGKITTASGNEGACGRLERLAEGGRLLGRKEHCSSVWRYRAQLETTSRGLKVREELSQTESPRFKLQHNKRTLVYQLGRGMLRSKRPSLLRKIKRPKSR